MNTTSPLQLRMQFLRAAESGDPFAFRFEPQDYVLPTEGGSSPTARFAWTPEFLCDLQAVRRPGRDAAVVQRVGETLRRFIQDAGWAAMEQEIDEALAADRNVIVSIRSSAAELYALPWELLTRRSGQFLGEDPRVLLRFEWPDSDSAPEAQRPRAEGGRILFAWSAAGGAVPAAEQLAAIESASRQGCHPFQRHSDVLAHASLVGIARVLEDAKTSGRPVDVLHLLCHGGPAGSTFGLLLNGEQGSEATVTATELRQQLAPFAKMVRLVVVSACDSGNSGDLGNHLGSVAQVLHRAGFHTVLASRFPLSVAGSIALTETLYRKLLVELTSLEVAVLAVRQRLGREALKRPLAERDLDWAALQLYARHADGDDARPIVFRPYRGLLTFLPEHRRFFHGRDAEIAEVLHDFQALLEKRMSRFLLVAGASGTGKSSLVLAKVVPWFGDREGPTVQVLRPSAGGPAALQALLSARGDPERPLLLVVDQFEEIFTTLAAEPRQAFVQQLWSLAADPASNVGVLVTLRVDFMGQCGEIVLDATGLRLDKVAYDEAHRVFISQLGESELRQVIERPAARVGLSLQPGLCDRLLADVGNEPGALPLLEYALDQLWQRRDGRQLTQSAYQELGGVSGALEREADRAFSSLDGPSRELARHLLIALVSVGEQQALDTRQRRKLVELRPADASHAARFDRVLDKLVNLRLLVRSELQNEPAVEVAHEALIRRWQTLRAWIHEDREALQVLQALSRQSLHWDSSGRLAEDLWRGRRLQRALALRGSHPLTTIDEAFLQAAETEAQKQELAERERLQNQQDTDFRIGMRIRNRALLGSTALAALIWVLTLRSGITHGRLIVLLAMSCVGAVALARAARRSEMASTLVNRVWINQTALLFIMLFCHHLIAAALAIPIPTTVPVDCLLMATLYLSGTTWLWDRKLWIVGVPSLIAAAGATLWPAAGIAFAICAATLQLLMGVFVQGKSSLKDKPHLR